MRTRAMAAAAAAVLTAAGTAVSIVGPGSPAAAHPVNAADFQQVELARGVAELGEPMSMAVLPDRSVLHTARNGVLRRTTATGVTSVIGTLPVYTHDEEGLQGVGVDPGFSGNRFIYLFYAPPLSTPGGDAPATGTDFSAWNGVNRLARFTLNADYTLNTGSQVTVLEVATSRGMCCHVGGDIDFDAAGNLYLSTGDDSNPFDSGGYTPIDERTNRNPVYDAQRSSGNTNDLRGKVLRIKVNPDGTYSNPPGNLFPPGTARTRPEIYAMGFRNPFRLSVDRATGAVYVADYGPDAGTTTSTRGPAGQVEFNRITSAGNYGWPYCTGSNTTSETYVDYVFPSGPSGSRFNCSAPVNNSPRNTGLTNLPAARAAWIKYDNCSLAAFGCGSESPMGGAVYRYDASNPSTVKFPAALDGHYFATEFGRRWIKTVDVNSDGSAGQINDFPWRGTQIMDSAFGPDGALYVLDYGTGWGSGDASSALYRIEYNQAGNNQAPVARAAAGRTSGTAPLTVAFSSSGSADPEGGALTYAWNFGDGATSSAANPSHTFTGNGQRTVTLTVTDPAGLTASASVTVTVGNTAPTVVLTTPADGSLFAFGDSVPYTITVSDPEDGTVDCSRVKLSYLLGHDNHAHEITSSTGCSGTLRIPVDGEHDDAANLYAVFDAQYTDLGANGQPALTTHTQHVMQPRHRQAEHRATQSGTALFSKTTAEGGQTVGDIQNGDWIAFPRYVLAGETRFTARVSSGGSGGTLSVRAGSATGTVLGTVTVPGTGSWETFTEVSTALSGAPAGTTTLYLTFHGGTGTLFDVDAFTFGTAPVGGTGRIVGAGGSCVDVNAGGTADGTKIQLWTCNAGANQQWTRTGSTWRALGKCMGVAGGATADGGAVQLSTCTGAGGQNWTAGANGSLVNTQSGKCLDANGGSSANGTQLIIWSCHGGTNQRFTLP